MRKERELITVRNNAALLDSLGLSSVPSVRPHETKPRIGKTEARLKSERSGSGAGVKRRKVVVEPTRRSGRVRAMAEDEEEGKKRKYVYVYVFACIFLRSFSMAGMIRRYEWYHEEEEKG